MSEESDSISDKTWARAADPISKVGYADGAVEGQTAAFQPSFDKGYELGFNFGLQVGFKDAALRSQGDMETPNFTDPRRINCQVCLNPVLVNEDLDNVINTQKAKNDEIFEMPGATL